MTSHEPVRTVSLHARDGAGLHVAHWSKGSPRGVVIFLHGLCSHGGWYGELATVLQAAGWSMVAPDLRGHGLSDGPRGGLSKDDDLMHDLAVVVDHVRQVYGGLPCVLIGHSSGGLLAARFALKDTRRAAWQRPVEGLILLAPALQPTLSLTQKALLTTLGRLLLDVGVPTGIDLSWAFSDPAVITQLADDPLTHDRLTPRFALFLAREGQQVLEHASTWQTPTLMLYSLVDRLVTPEGCERFAAMAPLDVVNAKAYAKMAHGFLQEPDRAMVHEDIVRWLKRQFPL